GDKRGEHHEPGDGPGSEEPGKGPGGPGHDPDAPPERDPWVPPPDASFGARVPPPEVDVPTRGVGQSCSSWGASDCKGGVCLKVAPLPNPLQVCTRHCEAPGECPSSWQCIAARPGGPKLCVPPIEISRQLRDQSFRGTKRKLSQQ